MKYVCSDPQCTARKFTPRGTTSTLLGWQPEYNADGLPTSADPNWTTTGYTCNDCGSEYTCITKGWLTRWFNGYGNWSLFDSGDHFHSHDATPSHVKEEK